MVTALEGWYRTSLEDRPGLKVPELVGSITLPILLVRLWRPR